MRKVYVIDQEMNAKFMELAEKSDETSLSEMERMRMQMVNNAQKVKLFNDFKEMHNQVNECQSIINEPGEDREIKDIAKEELEGVQE